MPDATPFSSYLACTPTQRTQHLGEARALAEEHPENPIGLTLILEHLEAM
ncbi:hypothetical protein [Brevibacterium jeotgali]|uniref:Tetratricopeptide repeat-containing protein n=1 Tax=Brevibacterium jeotgali TaxID=1262550 RepID=A0A2H1L7E1_9MICO|nr:hypothetical protein [Brevibacterium jeotgali]TWC03139.1 hypothetical protein FB108_1851 [Brevibacterium jeotgali]SMY12802.1 hypothetical protein BJEO58_02409 [Brevibacterium jeotgali]